MSCNCGNEFCDDPAKPKVSMVGWICPRCYRSNSPAIKICQCGIHDDTQPPEKYRQSDVTIYPPVKLSTTDDK